MSITPITRGEVIRRAATIWPLGTVQYNMQAVRNPGWRTDCSGYVSMCLNLVSTKPGATTVTLVTDGYIQEITRDDLQPGDLIGHCGPGTGESGGHVVLFDHWADGHETYWAYEQHGGHHPEPFGPEHSVITYPYHGLEGFKPYRYRGIQDGPGTHVPAGGNGHGHFVSVTAWPDRLSTIGGIAAASGIADWHKIWNDPENAGLRAHRVVPEHVQPGDAVWVPAP